MLGSAGELPGREGETGVSIRGGGQEEEGLRREWGAREWGRRDGGRNHQPRRRGRAPDGDATKQQQQAPRQPPCRTVPHPQSPACRIAPRPWSPACLRIGPSQHALARCLPAALSHPSTGAKAGARLAGRACGLRVPLLAASGGGLVVVVVTTFPHDTRASDGFRSVYSRFCSLVLGCQSEVAVLAALFTRLTPLLPSATGSPSRELGVGQVAEAVVAPCVVSSSENLYQIEGPQAELPQTPDTPPGREATHVGAITGWHPKMGPRNRENTEAETTRSTGLPKARPTTPMGAKHSQAKTAVQARATRNTQKRREENAVTTIATKLPPLAAKRGTHSPHALLASLAPASAPAQGRDKASTETHQLTQHHSLAKLWPHTWHHYVAPEPTQREAVRQRTVWSAPKKSSEPLGVPDPDKRALQTTQRRCPNLVFPSAPESAHVGCQLEHARSPDTSLNGLPRMGVSGNKDNL
ncbi:hypothetical protein Taro_022638 [Colocasia esculenta]|uniref:Uncharacterized protein n=1 Tax=Colocasia esculenta TaxID=4460 RepID=A0A843V251_COLES|nr:hypothetical protein [Colocasia esculenta]